MIPELIDNKDYKLKDAVNKLLEKSVFSKMAVGYFYLSGFDSIKDKLDKISNLKILIGNSTNQETLDEMVEGFIRLDIAENYKRTQQDVLNRDKKKVILQKTIDQQKEQVSYLAQSTNNEEAINSLADLIEQGKVHIRVYTRGKLHSKAYLFEFESDDIDKGIGIVGSSNLTYSGISHNSEMNILVKGQAHFEKLNEWFDRLWGESEDFDEAIINVITSSWVKYKATPYEIYLKTLYKLVKDRIEIDKTITILEEMNLPDLYEFQRHAFHRAIKILDRFNGVFISDVVGLGKSFIGAALIKYFRQSRGMRTLIICPASLMRMWDGDDVSDGYNQKFDLGAKVISMGKLLFPEDKKGNRNFSYSLLKEEIYENYDMVLIDESHNFRNNKTQRYRVLAPYLLGKKVILLTATPQNKSIYDVYHQLKLFHPYEKTNVPIQPNELKKFFDLCDKTNPANVYSLLRHLLIRRRRRDIINSKIYNREENGKKLSFPKRELQTVDYSIASYQNKGFYEDIKRLIGDKTLLENENDLHLNYARYSLNKYLKNEAKNKKQYENISRFGDRLIGLMKMLLFKRFESSVFAFFCTVRKMFNTHRRFLELLKSGTMVVGRESLKQMSLLDDTNYSQEIIDLLESENIQYDINDFHVEKLMEDIENDIMVFQKLMNFVKPIVEDYLSWKEDGKNEFPHITLDDKIDTLINLIRNNEREKILIFTEFQDTALYVHDFIKNEFRDREVEVIFSGKSNSANIINRFAPIANNYRIKENERQIDILISTDVLSEGQNLQDASTVINLDIHWNPVRLIQRIGRVDRIGSEAEVIKVFNFLPEPQIERTLSLRQRVHQRIQEIHNLLGLDNKVLSQREIINEKRLYEIDDESMEKIYTKKEEVLDDVADEEEFGIDRAERIILEIKNNDPELFEKIKNIPDGARSAIRAGNPGETYAFCESKDFQRLYLLDTDNKLHTDMEEILKKIECDPNTPSQALPRDHNNRLKRIENDFSRELRIFLAEKESKKNLTLGQKYISRELEAYFRQITDSEERRRVDTLRSIFTLDLPHYVNAALGMLKKQKVKGKVLVKRLTKFYNAYSLSSLVSKMRDERKKEKLKYKVICSEGFV